MNLQAFLDGLTGAGFFGRLRWPGAPTELIDSRGELSRAEVDALMPSAYNLPSARDSKTEGLFRHNGSGTAARAKQPEGSAEAAKAHLHG